jgi:hypothetical protein
VPSIVASYSLGIALVALDYIFDGTQWQVI